MKSFLIGFFLIITIIMVIISCEDSSSPEEEPTYEASGSFTYNTETDTLTFHVTSSNFADICGLQVGTISMIVASLTDTSTVIYFPEEGVYDIWIRNDDNDGTICGVWNLYINGREVLNITFSCAESSTETLYSGDFVLSGECVTNTQQSNEPPVINNLVANPSNLFPGGTSSLSCTASDPDENDLTYTWSADFGSINGIGNAVSWTAPDSFGTYLITCTVSDGHGGKVTDGINITTSLIGEWQTGTPLPAGRAAHTCVANNGYMYIIGGTDGDDLSDVLFAAINVDGSIVDWDTTASFEVGRSNHSSFIQNGFLYLIGCWDTVVKYASITGDGTITDWDSTTSLASGILAHSTVVYNDYVYVLGGFNDSAPSGLSYVLYAQINGDGTLGSWQTTNSFTDGRYDHSSIAHNGYVYVIGGDNGTSLYDDVQYAPINPDGTVGTWNPTSSLPANLTAHTSFVYNGYLFVTGGNNTQIIFAQIHASGTVGNWITNPHSFTHARGNHTSIVYDGYLYIIGGSIGANPLDDVQYAPLLGMD